MMDKTIQIVNSVAADDPLDWIRDHPAFAGDDFEVICAALPIPGGGEIPLLGLSGGGVTTLVDRSTGHPRRDLERMARSISFLRRDGEWVSRSFPDRVFRQIEKPRLIVMISDTDEAFLESLHGLALSRLSIVRARNVQSADGMCALPRSEIIRLHASSGTTGKTINTFYTARDHWHRQLWWGRAPPYQRR